MPSLKIVLASTLLAALCVDAGPLTAQTRAAGVSTSRYEKKVETAGFQKKMGGTPVSAQDTPVLLRFQLIKATETRTTDSSIKEIDAALKDLFRFPGYKLLAQAAIMLDYGSNVQTMQRLSAEGVTYQLGVLIQSITADAAQLEVKLWVLDPASSAGQLFGTKVSVSFNHTVVLGSTQLSGASGGTLVMAVKPELQMTRGANPAWAPEAFTFDQVDDPVRYVAGPTPRYPDSLKARGVSGQVRMRFNVSTTGQVEPSSIQILSSTNPGFEKPAIDAIVASTFRPAIFKGTKVRQMVEQVVRFTPESSPQGSTTSVSSAAVYKETFTTDQVDDPVTFVGGPSPVYPTDLKAAKIAGRVTLRFIVGVDGKAESGTVKVLNSTNKEFEQPAIEAISKSTFRPATIKGTKVRQIVEQVVRFTPG